MPKRKTTVLIADDDLQLLDLVTLHLELEGYDVLRVSDGRQDHLSHWIVIAL
jgi:DNA-binding response OmpR family regulator